MNSILKLDITGTPCAWIPWEEAVAYYFKDKIAYELGSSTFTIHGGFNELGEQSTLDINSIIAVKDRSKVAMTAPNPSLTKRREVLFFRDQYTCMYCGNVLSGKLLTIDHVIPRAHGGSNAWSNIVTSCHPCNAHKADRTPEQAKMPLLAVPYTPNKAEWLILKNRTILADQMEFLSKFTTSRFKYEK